jgi:RNA polymerase sigma-70 factor (ECF subfamily)
MANVVRFPRGGAVSPAAEAVPPGPSNEALVEALRSADPDAPGILWDRHAIPLRAILRRALGPGCEVEDALQEVFLQFFRSLASLREPQLLGPFLVGIAVRVSRSELRRRRIRRWLFLTETGEVPEPEADGDPAREHAREAVKRLYAVLDGLDDESRMLFVLRSIERLELAEVAVAMRMSLATVKRKLARVTPVVVARARRDEILARYLRSDLDARADDVLAEGGWV